METNPDSPTFNLPILWLPQALSEAGVEALHAWMSQVSDRIDLMRSALINARSILPNRPDDPINQAVRQEIARALGEGA